MFSKHGSHGSHTAVSSRMRTRTHWNDSPQLRSNSILTLWASDSAAVFSRNCGFSYSFKNSVVRQGEFGSSLSAPADWKSSALCRGTEIRETETSKGPRRCSCEDRSAVFSRCQRFYTNGTCRDQGFCRIMEQDAPLVQGILEFGMSQHSWWTTADADGSLCRHLER